MNQKLNRNSVQRFNGLSTDTKPTTCNNGSTFVEIDTGKKYIFNKADGTWTEIPSSGSGGTNNYNSLVNKPTINGVTVQGDLTSSDLHINGVGKDVAGTEYVIDGQTITAKSGAEIFNSYDGASANKAAGTSAHAEGISTVAKGDASHSEGVATSATASNSHAEGAVSKATGSAAHAEGNATTASGVAAHTEGGGTTASGAQSHAEGISTVASEAGAHAEGNAANASGAASHAEGYGTQASGVDSHAEGSWCIASGLCAHAEGGGTEASGNHSHAEGTDTEASGLVSHAEGEECKAIGLRSHAEGQMTQAIGMNSHAEGEGTIANTNQHVEGKYNVQDNVNKFAHIIGNGSGAAAADRHNAYAIDWSGKIYVNGAEEGVDVSVLDTEVDVVANAGAKNIFDIQAATTVQRTTTVLNPDGGITISCNAASWATRNIIAEIPAGDYICSLFVDAVTIGGGTFAFFVNQSDDKSTWTELARQTSITSIGRIDKLISVSQKYLRITTNINNSDTSATNSATIRLMLRPAAITDPTFVPYALPNPTLTPAAIKAVDEGAKNLLHTTAQSQTVNGVTFTVNDDQTITVNGTASETTTYMLVPNTQAILIPDGDYILSGCPNGGGDSTYDLRWYLYSSGKSAYDKGSGASVTKDGNTTSSNIAIVIRSGVTASDLVFKPMICTAADFAVSQKFVPYCPANRELYEDLQTKVTLVKVFGRGVGISNNDDLDTYQTLGRYCASNGTIAASLSNCPVTTGFVLTVTESFQTNGGIVQTIETLVSGETQIDLYKRMRIYRNNAWSWGDWYKFEGTAVSTQSAPASLMQAGRIDAELTDAGTYDTLSMQPETLTNGTTEMSGAEQDETENTEAER